MAMGTGTDVAMHAAGITLMRGDVGLVAGARHFAADGAKIRQNLFWAFAYNVAGIAGRAGLPGPVVAGAAMAPEQRERVMTTRCCSGAGAAWATRLNEALMPTLTRVSRLPRPTVPSRAAGPGDFRAGTDLDDGLARWPKASTWAVTAPNIRSCATPQVARVLAPRRPVRPQIKWLAPQSLLQVISPFR